MVRRGRDEETFLETQIGPNLKGIGFPGRQLKREVLRRCRRGEGEVPGNWRPGSGSSWGL